MDSIELLFRRLVFQPRALRSICWSLTFVPVYLLAYFAMVNLAIFHPIDWLFDILSFLFSFACLWHSFLLAIIAFFTFGFTVTSVKVTPPKISSIVAAVGLLLTIPNLSMILIYGLSSALASCQLLSMCGGRYVPFFSGCYGEPDRLCWNDYKWFIIIFCGLAGMLFSAESSLFGHYCLHFPVVEQPVLFHVKSRLWPMIKKTIVIVSVQLMVYFMVVFVLDLVWFGHTTMFPIDEYEHDLGSLWTLFDLRLLYHALLCGVAIRIMWSVGLLLIKCYLMQSYHFAVTESSDTEKLSLIEAMKVPGTSLVKMLALRDLVFLATHADDARRQQVFSLSQPGGHPRTWRSIVTLSLVALRELLAKLNKACDSRSASSSQPVLDVGDNAFKKVETLTIRSFPDRMSPVPNGAHPEVKSTKGQFTSPISAVFKEYPDFICAELFADTQQHLSIARALAHLVACSYSEDKFGIVQHDLGQVLTVLLQLYETLERLFKSVPSLSRRPSDSFLNKKSHRLAVGLRSVLKMSIYKIAVTFGNQLSYIDDLTREHKKKLSSFVDFKE